MKNIQNEENDTELEQNIKVELKKHNKIDISDNKFKKALLTKIFV